MEKKQFKRILPAPPPQARPVTVTEAIRKMAEEQKSAIEPPKNPFVSPKSFTLKTKHGNFRVDTGIPANAYRSMTLFNDSAKPGEYKQWSAWIIERDVVTEWGRVGTNLQQSIKTYGSRARCVVEFEKLVTSKRAKGYRENV